MPPRRRVTPEEAQHSRAVEVLGGVARDMAHPAAAFFKASLLDEELTEEQAYRLTELFMALLLNAGGREKLMDVLGTKEPE